MVDFNELTKMAHGVAKPTRVSDFVDFGAVGAALVTENGNIYLGVNIDTACSIGFCAEHSAIAAMLTAGEINIKRIVAVGSDGRIMPPCGRCREFINQLSDCNKETEVLVAPDTVVTISELLPFDWRGNTR